MQSLRETLLISCDDQLFEMSLGFVKTSIDNLIHRPVKYVKSTVIDSWNMVKSKLGGTDKEIKLLEFYNYIFNKNYKSFSQIDYIFRGLEEGVSIGEMYEFYQRHSAVVISAAFALIEVFAQTMGYSSLILACIYVTITMAIFLFENEDEIVEFLNNLRSRVKNYLKFTTKVGGEWSGATGAVVANAVMRKI